MLHQDRNYAFLSGLTILTIILWLDLFGASFHTWFLREDSWYFRLAPFSIYDLGRAFLQPINQTGFYRPFQDLYWHLPKLLGYFEPKWIRFQTYFFHLLAAYAVFSLCCQIVKSKSIAWITTLAYLLMPIHAKTLYWLCAQHSIGNATFLGLSLLFRLQRKKRWSLVFFLLAITQRVTSISWLPILFLVDILKANQCSGQSTKPRTLYFPKIKIKIKIPYDLIGLTVFLIGFFSLGFLATETSVNNNSPVSDFNFFHSLLNSPSYFMRYLLGLLGGIYGDSIIIAHKWSSFDIVVVSMFLILILTILITETHRPRLCLIPVTIIIFSILPFAIFTKRGMNLEYLGPAAIGLAMIFAITLEKITDNINYLRRRSLHFFVYLLLIIASYTRAIPATQVFEREYYAESIELRKFIYQMKQFDKDHPNITNVYIANEEPLDQNVFQYNRRSIPFIINGLNEYVPRKFFFFSHNLGTTSLQNHNISMSKKHSLRINKFLMNEKYTLKRLSKSD